MQARFYNVASRPQIEVGIEEGNASLELVVVNRARLEVRDAIVRRHTELGDTK